MSNKKFTSAVILAAGIGSRMNSDITKQKMQIGNKSVLYRAVSAFEKAESVDEIIVVCREEELDFSRSELSDLKKIKSFTVGGLTRRDSAKNGFLAISDEACFVAVHDAARCMISPKLINEVAAAAYKYRAATAASLVTDTIKLTDSDGMITKTVPRASLRAANTPQIFERKLYETALLRTEGIEVTDDNMMIESIGVPIRAVESNEYNFKITTKKDIEYAEFLIDRGYIDE